MERALRRFLAVAACASWPLLAQGCAATLAPIGHALIYVDTDAPLAAGPGSQMAFDEPAPLFDGLRVDVLDANGAPACPSCTRDFAIDRDGLSSGSLSLSVVPREGVPVRVRFRMFRRVRLRGGEPPKASTIDVVTTLPGLPPEGVSEWTAYLPIARLAAPPGEPFPLVRGKPIPHESLGTAQARGCNGAPDRPGQVCIPGGTFWMRNAERAVSGTGEDLPERAVLLGAFYLDAREVTVAELRASGVVSASDPTRGAGPSRACTYTAEAGPNEDLPATCLSWNLAAAYCSARGARLPTETELEFASSGRRSDSYPWGNDPPSCTDAIFARDPGDGDGTPLPGILNGCTGAGLGPAKAGSGARDRLVLPWGSVFDLAGNVSEWSSDRQPEGAKSSCSEPGYHENPRCAPQSPSDETPRAVRGGSFAVVGTRSLARLYFAPGASATFVGFRCAHDRRK